MGKHLSTNRAMSLAWVAILLAGVGCAPQSSVGHHTIPVTAATFQQEVLDSTIPVVVDFWASWCGPCKAIAPALENLAVEFDGRVKVCKVNVDACPDLAGTYDIQSIPALLAFKNGQVVDQRIGSADEESFRAWFASLP